MASVNSLTENEKLAAELEFLNSAEYLESSDWLRDPDTDVLRGLILPMMATLSLVVVGFVLAGGIGVIITIINNLVQKGFLP